MPSIQYRPLLAALSLSLPLICLHGIAFALPSTTDSIDLLPVPSPSDRDAELVFEQMSEKAISGQIINSDKSFKPRQLPAIFKVTLQDGSFCTATLVGPQVVITAAHCLDRKRRTSSGKWLVAGGGIKISGEAATRPFETCVMAPAYTAAKPKLIKAPRNSYDYALCKLATIVPLKAETLELKPFLFDATKVLLAGYGCSEDDLENGKIPLKPTSGLVLRAGFNKVDSKTINGWLALNGQLGTSEAVICPGDSGGSAYSGVSSLTEGYGKGWRVVAINSAVGPTPAGRTNSGSPERNVGRRYTSYLSGLSTAEFSELVTLFMSSDGETLDRSRGICGINRSAPSSLCRP